jgi:integrase
MASVWKHPKSKYWYARFLGPDGRWRNASTRKTDRKQALKTADEYEAAGQARRTAAQVRRVISRLHGEITGESLPCSSVSAFVSAWLAEKKGTAASTQTFYKNSTKKFLLHLGPVANEELSMIAKDHVLAFRNEMLETLSPKAVNHHLKVVKMVFRSARRDGYIIDDPSEFVETVREKTGTAKRRRPFTLDEVRAVFAVADDEWRSMILFGLYTGQRLGDIARLTWANVDLGRNEIRLVTQKTGASLLIPMAPPLREHVDSLPTPDSRPDEAPLHPKAFALLVQKGKTGTLSNRFADLLALAGLREKKPHRASTGEGRAGRHQLEALSFHSLRHTAVTFLKEAGIPAAVVQKFIGHESSQISDLYTSVGTESLTKAATAFPKL